MYLDMNEFDNSMKFILFATDNESLLPDEDKAVLYLFKEIALLLTEESLKDKHRATGTFKHLPDVLVKITGSSENIKEMEEKYGRYVADTLLNTKQNIDHDKLLLIQFFIHYIILGNIKEVQDYMNGWNVRFWNTFTEYKTMP